MVQSILLPIGELVFLGVIIFLIVKTLGNQRADIETIQKENTKTQVDLGKKEVKIKAIDAKASVALTKYDAIDDKLDDIRNAVTRLETILNRQNSSSEKRR